MSDDPAGYKDGTRYGWQEGDLQHIRPGSGGPLISPEEMDRILAQPTSDTRQLAPRRFLHIHRPRGGR
jgi:hypothetical protein